MIVFGSRFAFGHLKTSLREPAAHLDGTESEPQISVQLSHRLVFVLGKLHHGEFATGGQSAPSFSDGRLRSGHVMQNHAGHDRVDLTIGDGQVFQISKTKLASIHGSFTSRLPRQLQHRRRRIDSDHLVGTIEQRRQQQA